MEICHRCGGEDLTLKNYCRDCWRQSKYGITKEEYQILRYEKQQNLCAHCQEPFTEKKRAVIDYDRLTNRVRAILHNGCNNSRPGRRDIDYKGNLRTKLTDEQVIAVRTRRKRGETLRQLADEFGLSVAGIWRITTLRTRKAVK